MAPQTQRTITIGVLTTVLAVGVIALLSEARASVVPRGEFDLHSQAIVNWQSSHVQADSARWREIQTEQRAVKELTLEVLCEVKPQARVCR